jgi:hypothetical protein
MLVEVHLREFRERASSALRSRSSIAPNGGQFALESQARPRIVTIEPTLYYPVLT